MMIGSGGWRRRRRRSTDETLRMPAVLIPMAHRMVRVYRWIEMRMSAAHATAKPTATKRALAVQRLHHVAHHTAKRQTRPARLLLLTL